MKSIDEVKNGMPPGLAVWCDNALNDAVKEYATEQLGEEEYNRLATPNEGEDTTDLDALSQDFIRGFWYAVELFNMNFNE
jgi:hypothetical protein